MLASPINPSDLVPVAGAYPYRTALPFVPGFEGVGTVERLGSAAAAGAPLRPGQRVLPLGSAGGGRPSRPPRPTGASPSRMASPTTKPPWPTSIR
ncbi:alcohol dehydrogenase catalytic domain-containing protein (plasmid) [Roseomonas sp. CCTCC AB2023176]|uniref:alcohol dehydrogenase catalytic domain-containing protein n=1 Tax=Roseomonas sp. CCTCC AB2023176 TaxID=3342640 RepID=UPI0035D63594